MTDTLVQAIARLQLAIERGQSDKLSHYDAQVGERAATLGLLSAIALRETGGPTELGLGAVGDGQFLKRSGATLVGASPGTIIAKNVQTLYVAAVDAASNAAADYTCDGVNDQVEIKAALDALAATGKPGRVLLSDGNFTFGDKLTILTGYSNLEIVGAGMFNTTIKGNPGIDKAYIDLSQATGVTLSHFRLADFYIDGTSWSGGSGFPNGTLNKGLILDTGLGIISHLTVERVRGYCPNVYTGGLVVADNVTAGAGPNNNWTIRDCRFQGDGDSQYGIKHKKNFNYLRIERNYIELTKASDGSTGVGGYNCISVYGGGSYFTVAGNFCKANKNHSPIAISVAAYGEVIGNNVYCAQALSSEAGIEVQWKAGHSDDVRLTHDVAVVGNTVFGAYWGISVNNNDVGTFPANQPYNILIDGNTIASCTNRDIRVNDNSVVTIGVNTHYNPPATPLEIFAGCLASGRIDAVQKIVIRSTNDGTNALEVSDTSVAASGAKLFELRNSGRVVVYEQLQMGASGAGTINKTVAGDITIQTNNGNFAIDPRAGGGAVSTMTVRNDGDVYIKGRIKFTLSTDFQTTVGAAGAASALPLTPSKYLKIIDDTGAVLVVPAYAAS